MFSQEIKQFLKPDDGHLTVIIAAGMVDSQDLIICYGRFARNILAFHGKDGHGVTGVKEVLAGRNRAEKPCRQGRAGHALDHAESGQKALDAIERSKRTNRDYLEAEDHKRHLCMDRRNLDYYVQ